MKMSGVEYPLEERSVKEMGFKHSVDVFRKPWFVSINLKENQIQKSDICLHGWFQRGITTNPYHTIQNQLAKDGFVKCSRQYTFLDIDNTPEISDNIHDKIEVLKKTSDTAKFK